MNRVLGWHNISTNSPSINVDKITFEDLVTIINNLRYKYHVLKKNETDVTIDDIKKDLYSHVVDLNNPHEVSMGQLPNRVIDIFYERWLEEGYYGPENWFIYIIFKYVTAGSYEDLVRCTPDTDTLINTNDEEFYFKPKVNYRATVTGDTEIVDDTDQNIYKDNTSLVPVVRDFYNYLHNHDTSLLVERLPDKEDSVRICNDTPLTQEQINEENVHTHSTLLHEWHGYDQASHPGNKQLIPSITYSNIGVPFTVQERLVGDKYVDIPVSKLAFPEKATVFLHGSFTSGQWFHIKNKDDANSFFTLTLVTKDTDTSSKYYNHSYVDLTVGVGNPNYSTMVIFIDDLLEDIRNNADKITIIIEFNGTKLGAYIQMYGMFMQVPISSKFLTRTIDGKLELLRYPKKPRPTYTTLMTLPRMSLGDYLEIISIYPYILSENQLSYLFNIYN